MALGKTIVRFAKRFRGSPNDEKIPPMIVTDKAPLEISSGALSVTIKSLLSEFEPGTIDTQWPLVAVAYCSKAQQFRE